MRQGASVLVVALAAGLLAIVGCSRSGKQDPPARSMPVVVATVERQAAPLEVHSPGQVEAYSTVAVKSMVAGPLTEVHFREGQDVKKGDLLFVIDPRPFDAALKQAQGLLAKDQAQADNAEREAKRTGDLYKRGAATEDEYATSVSNAKALAAAVQADQAAVEDARLQLGYCDIRSPIDGRAGALLVNAGNLVKANDVPLVNIDQIRPIYVTFSVPQRYLPLIEQYTAKHALDVTAGIPSQPQDVEHGVLTFVDNTVDPTTGAIKLKGTFQNQGEHLWPGLYVNVTLTLTEDPDAIVAPSVAVQTGQQGTFVFVVRPDMTVEQRAVTVERSLDDHSVISWGLKPGERVVTDGQLQLVPGAHVVIVPPVAGTTSQPAGAEAESGPAARTMPATTSAPATESMPATSPAAEPGTSPATAPCSGPASSGGGGQGP